MTYVWAGSCVSSPWRKTLAVVICGDFRIHLGKQYIATRVHALNYVSTVVPVVGVG